MKQENEIWTSVHKVLTGEASVAEQANLQTWRDQSVENDRLFQLMEAYWHQQTPIPAEAADRTYSRIQQKIQAAEASPAASTQAASESAAKVRPLWRKKYRQIWAAASIVLLLAVGTVLWIREYAQDRVQWVEQVNRKGSTSQISLADGSTVWLNADSKLKYPKRFISAERVVYLEGEAYFEVEADSSHPFIVKTNELSTRVLGTAFNVQAYPEKDEIQVTVTEGKVAVAPTTAPKEETVLLVAREKMVYDRQQQQSTRSVVDSVDLVGWKDGALVFEDADLTEIALQLERWYGVYSRVEGQSNTLLQFNGTFTNKNLETVMEALSLTAGISYEIKQDTLVLQAGSP